MMRNRKWKEKNVPIWAPTTIIIFRMHTLRLFSYFFVFLFFQDRAHSIFFLYFFFHFVCVLYIQIICICNAYYCVRGWFAFYFFRADCAMLWHHGMEHFIISIEMCTAHILVVIDFSVCRASHVSCYISGKLIAEGGVLRAHVYYICVCCVPLEHLFFFAFIAIYAMYVCMTNKTPHHLSTRATAAITTTTTAVTKMDIYILANVVVLRTRDRQDLLRGHRRNRAWKISTSC